MAERALWAFDHVPPGLSNTGGNIPALHGSGLTMHTNATLMAGLATTNIVDGVLSDSDGVWMDCPLALISGTNWGGRGMGLPLSALFDLTTRASYFGFRFKCTLYDSTLLGLYQCWISNLGSGDPFLLFNGIRPSTDGKVSVTQAQTSIPLNEIHYFEFKWDRIAKLITMSVDGIQMSVTPYGNVPLSTYWLVFGHTGAGATSGGATFLYKDMYFVDDTQDSRLPNGRMGLLRSRPLALASAAGTGWTATAGQASLLASLQSPVTATAGTLTTPLVTSSLAGLPPPLNLQFTNSVPGSGVDVIAVSLLESAQRVTGTSSELKGSLTDGTNTLPLTTQQFTSDAQLVRATLGSSIVAPDGSPWTPAKLAAATFTLQPAPLGN